MKYLALILFIFNVPVNAFPDDADMDGLDDRLEQRLLEKFAPTLMLSEKECDGLPAEFIPEKPAPLLLAKNGTVYGQVFPTVLSERPGIFIEVHYYHLWNRDCGLNGHALDAEHVSVLLSAETSSEAATDWKSEYWFAAAHEDTVCDSSHAIKSAPIDAEQRGPTVWISAGKHASFLDRDLCRGGCGSDNCSMMRPIEISKLVNIGEPGAPMNGVLWTQWAGWPLSEKMETDFPETVLMKLDAVERPVATPVNDAHAPVKTTILVGSSSAEALLATNKKTGTALSSATDAVGKSLNRSKNSTGNFLMRAARSVWNALERASDEIPE